MHEHAPNALSAPPPIRQRHLQDIFWVAELEGTREKVVGSPSWKSSGAAFRGPSIQSGMPESSDWQRLMIRCKSENVKLNKLSLYVNGRWFHSPEGLGSYGYFEQMVMGLKVGRKRGGPSSKGVEALAICYPDKTSDRGWHIKICKIFANGLYEEWRRVVWPSCMIGPREFPDENLDDKKMLSC